MQLVYGHDTFVILKMKYMPSPPAPLGDDRCFATVAGGKERRAAWYYDDRGWPFVEDCVSNARQAVTPSRWEFPGEEVMWEWGHDDNVKFFGKGRAISPAAFERGLEQKTFTNGSDRALVAKLYAKTFETIKAAKEQMFLFIGFDTGGLRDYADTLVHFDCLERIGFCACPNVGDEGFKLIFDVVTRKASLKNLIFAMCNLTDDACKHIIKNAPHMPNLQEVSLGGAARLDPAFEDMSHVMIQSMTICFMILGWV